MADNSIQIGLGDVLPYLEERFLKLIGRDQESRETAEWFTNLQKTALSYASRVKCIGMHSPLPLSQIYQPTRLRVRGLAEEEARRAQSFSHDDKATRSIVQGHALQERTLCAEEFLKRNDSAIVLAGPGWGKTTFLHHVFLKSVILKEILPVLISLKRPTALEDLQKFVKIARKVQKKQNKSETLLLVDGYDELPSEKRKLVSDAILSYRALEIGNFYVTCREYYHVFDVHAPEARIDGFTLQDQYRYVKTFLKAFGSTLDAVKVVDEFHTRGFEDFLSHPLLLALACIVKTSAVNVQSRSVLRLLERAIDVLVYRWDEEKGIDRQSRTPLDGRDRIQILKRMAYKTKSRHVTESRALTTAKEQLDLLQFDKVDCRRVLLETAQFFGIFVPSEDGWEFVHKTLHDYLAAQFWVETGEFAKSNRGEWDARTAYAACLSGDATPIMQRALSAPEGLGSFVEILSNSPNFNPKIIADALINYYSRTGIHEYFDANENLKVTAHLPEDFVCHASSTFLDFLVERCSTGRSWVNDTIAGYCMLELLRRRTTLSFITYDKAFRLYGSSSFTFDLLGDGIVRLGDLKPIPGLVGPRS